MDSAGENTVNSVETATSGSEGLQNRKSQLGFASRDDATDRKLGRWQRCSVSTTVMGTLIGLIWALWVFFSVLYYTGEMCTQYLHTMQRHIAVRHVIKVK